MSVYRTISELTTSNICWVANQRHFSRASWNASAEWWEVSVMSLTVFTQRNFVADEYDWTFPSGRSSTRTFHPWTIFYPYNYFPGTILPDICPSKFVPAERHGPRAPRYVTPIFAPLIWIFVTQMCTVCTAGCTSVQSCWGHENTYKMLSYRRETALQGAL